ncbi:hypothetical protein SDC9_202571 [bioreactor metagenome]|uniref:Uncharacterized protein n=1 Tax=bioreactor metagenome TaxID=1076179 RepID=A0A645J5Z8_9ZZZZ
MFDGPKLTFFEETPVFLFVAKTHFYCFRSNLHDGSFQYLPIQDRVFFIFPRVDNTYLTFTKIYNIIICLISGKEDCHVIARVIDRPDREVEKHI